MMMAETSSNAAQSGAILSSVAHWTDRIIVVASVVVVITALTAMFVSLMAEVVVRYLTNQGMGWPTEMPNILFPWLVMGGIVLAAQRGQHIAVTALQAVLGRTGNKLLLMLHSLLIAFTFFYLAWIGLDVVEITGSEVYPVTGLSAKWAYLAMIVGFIGLGFTALTTLACLVHADDPLAVRAHHIEEDV